MQRLMHACSPTTKTQQGTRQLQRSSGLACFCSIQVNRAIHMRKAKPKKRKQTSV